MLERKQGAGLFLPMGYGKTAINLCSIQDRHLPVVVCAPKRVAEHVWPAEHALWRSDLTLALAAGTPAQRARALEQRADITVIGRENLAEATGDYRTVIFDELSGFKTQGTARWKAGKRLRARVHHSWGLTGTPDPNGLLDLWAQMYLLDKGRRLGTGITHYRDRYFYPTKRLDNGTIVEWTAREEAEENIYRLIGDICLSMPEIEGLVPPVSYNRVTVEMPSSVREHYREIKRELVVALDDIFGGEVHSAANAAVLTGKLAQMAAGFIYADDQSGRYSTLHSEKLKALAEIVEGTGSPILVFYEYLPELEALRQAYPQGVMLDDRDAIPRWNAGQVPLLFAHPKSAGHGLNLQHGGHTIVWMTMPWDLELWLQGNRRLARPGQAHPVMIHTIEMEKSIDQVKMKRLETKEFKQEALLDYLRFVA